jgi:HSP20 family molecular chaperone IbpA
MMNKALSRLRQAIKRPSSGSKVTVHRAEPDDELLTAAHAQRPAADVYENDAHVLIVVDMPGADPKHVHVATDGERLIVRAPVAAATEGSERQWQRVFTMPAHLDGRNARVSYSLGVLRVELPKRKAEMKQIRVTRTA